MSEALEVLKFLNHILEGDVVRPRASFRVAARLARSGRCGLGGVTPIQQTQHTTRPTPHRSRSITLCTMSCIHNYNYTIMYMYTHTYLITYIHIFVYFRTRTYVYIYMCVCVRIHTYMCTNTCIHARIHMYIYYIYACTPGGLVQPHAFVRQHSARSMCIHQRDLTLTAAGR